MYEENIYITCHKMIFSFDDYEYQNDIPSINAKF